MVCGYLITRIVFLTPEAHTNRPGICPVGRCLCSGWPETARALVRPPVPAERTGEPVIRRVVRRSNVHVAPYLLIGRQSLGEVNQHVFEFGVGADVPWSTPRLWSFELKLWGLSCIALRGTITEFRGRKRSGG